MSCDRYHAYGCSIRFSDMDDDTRCLCSLTTNEVPDRDRVRSLAYLGAAFVICNQQAIARACDDYNAGRPLRYEADADYYYIPSGLPDAIRRGIDEVLK